MVEAEGELYEGEKEGGDERNRDTGSGGGETGPTKRAATSPLDSTEAGDVPSTVAEAKKTRLETEEKAEAANEEKEEGELPMDQS